MEPSIVTQARDLARTHALELVRIWTLRGGDQPALAASQSERAYSGGMTPSAVAEALLPAQAAPLFLPSTNDDTRFSGDRPQFGFVGFPIFVSGAAYGYIEAYAPGAISLSVAAKLEASMGEFAAAIALTAVGIPEASKGRILVADDDAGIRSLLRVILTRRGFVVDDASNGLLALESARRQLPDLILIDWMMPLMNGHETITQLKSDPKTRHIPIVMLTGQSQIDDKVAALEAGAQDFLTKPFDTRELVARVEQQMRWRKLLANVDPESNPQQEATVGATAVSAVSKAQVNAQPAHSDAPLPSDLLTGDIWSKAVEAGQLGKHREALALYLHEAERCDVAKQFPRAAIAYRSASIAAGQMQNLDLSNKLLRLSGKMYLSWAENASDARAIQEGYLGAARCFLTAGNLKLAKKATDFAHSYESVIADDHPPSLH